MAPDEQVETTAEHHEDGSVTVAYHADSEQKRSEV
jgi:hypothetical protein